VEACPLAPAVPELAKPSMILPCSTMGMVRDRGCEPKLFDQQDRKAPVPEARDGSADLLMMTG
jgi:hypothetical protein